MGDAIGGILIVIAIIIGAAIIVALAVATVVLVATITTVIYAVLLPSSYLLTMALLLRAIPPAGIELTEGAAQDADKEPPGNEEPWSTGRLPKGAAGNGRTHLPIPPPDPVLEGQPASVSFFDLPQLRGARERAWLGKHQDQLIAEPSYFFGPAADDIEGVARGCAERCRTCFRQGTELIRTLTADGESPLWYLCVVGICIGLVAGGIIGLAGAAVLGILNFLITVVTILGALFVSVMMRSLDATRRFVDRVRMPCPECHRAVAPYPTYRCPGCSKPHKDIRPGPRGIAFRNCECEARFPTSLLTGAGNLLAECPDCGVRLPDRFGAVPEIVIPFFGGLNVGKTQLMYTLVSALCVLVEMNGGTIDFEGDAAERLTRIGEDLALNGRPDKTIPEMPRAYILRLKLGLAQRLMYLFDAAGELHYTPEGLSQLNYLDKAKVLIFVADPLAADSLWAQVPAKSRAALADVRSSKAEGELAYQQTREQMRRMGGKRKYARLAVVVTKADLLEEMGITSVSGGGESSVRDLVWGSSGLDMGDVVREARQSFAAVKFFHTAAVIGDLGLPDGSVGQLARWLLWSEGIRLGRWTDNGA